MTMGERITALRKGRGMTQEQLAERLSVSRQSVSKWELDHASPELGFAVSLCEIFEVSLDYLIRGKEDETPAEEKKPASDAPKQETEIPIESKAQPLTAKGYALLFGVLLLVAVELFLHFLAFDALMGTKIAAGLIVLLYPLVIPLPAVYLATKRWFYHSRREAFRHVWKITAAVALVANPLIFGGMELYFLAMGNDTAFWQTGWETIWYQGLVAELFSLAILIPLLVRFHKKLWACLIFYVLSGGAFFGGILLQDFCILPIHAGAYWALADTGVRLLMVAALILSQIIVYRCLPKEETDTARPIRPGTVFASVALCSVAIPSVMGGLYYGLGIGGLSTAYLPLLYLPLPLLVLLLQNRADLSAAETWRLAGKTVGLFSPLMLAGHFGVNYFVQYVLSYGHFLSEPNWGGYLLISLLSSVAGGLMTIPAMIALRKRPRLCAVVYGAALSAAILATLFLPMILY